MLVVCAICTNHAQAQQSFVANEDESKVPKYELPPLFDGQLAESGDFAGGWSLRRKQLLELFAEQMYGTQPTGEFKVTCKKFEEGPSVGGKARRQQWRVTISRGANSLQVALLVFTPASATEPVPTFLGLNFNGNHTVAADPEIEITSAWCRDNASIGVVDHRASEQGRGTSQGRWPVELIVDAGFGVATAYYGELDPDFDDGFENGVHALFPEHRTSAELQNSWGSIAGWAWGLSRLLDGMEQDVNVVDAHRVVVIGHSRLGKTSLWAGATDTRFAAVISNDSGCGGAALSRRAFGETVGRINTSFPHWFCGNFKRYNLNEGELPIDQHQLISLMAPRPVYVASASEDLWADPRGEFLSAKIASTVYQRLGSSGLQLAEFPAPQTASVGVVSYHLREGKHDINAWDWQNYLKFAHQIVN
ncbi:MAG: acetylxylan esterase [Planctomycetales bacterium]|nr:acetylxylan esterase [Planctomycetales bacterium]